MATDNGYKYIGKPRKLVDGWDKVTGHLQFAGDFSVPRMLHGRLVLSPFAHARILDIDTSAALEIPGVEAVLTAADLVTSGKTIKSRNSATLAQDKVVWAGQPVAVIVAATEQAAEDAVDLVFVDYDPLPVTADLTEAIKPDAPAVWPSGLPEADEDLASLHAETVETDSAGGEKLNNVHNETHYARGDIGAGFAAADVIVERTYRTAIVHQAYLEPHACVVVPERGGRELRIYTGTQGKFVVRREVAAILGLSERQITVENLGVGGAFGAKYGILEPLTAAVALAMGQPVRIVMTRSDDFLSTTPAPAIQIDLKTGAAADGTVTALEARILVDNGIFSFNHGGIVSMLLGGTYKWPHLKIDAYEVYTHKPPVGAYRAPGAPQATVAVEGNMDEMAQRLGLDPLLMRLANAAETGDPMGNNRPWPSLGLKDCLRAIEAHPLWQDPQLGPNEAIGIAVGGWPTAVSPAEAVCRVDLDGTVVLSTGHADITSNTSSFVLIVAEILGVSPDQVDVRIDDTSGAYSPGSGGSQVTYSVASAVKQAAEVTRDRLLEIAANEFEAAPEDIELVDGKARVRGVPDRTIPLKRLARKGRTQRGGFGPVVGEGHSALPENAPGFAANLVKVRVDPVTGEVRPLHVVIAQDVGFAINPMLVQGQMHGGVAQALGMALSERMVFGADGQLLSGSFLDYAVPRSADVPTIETVLVENPSPHGPFGARGIGEPPIIATAAAIANAVSAAIGTRVTQLPLTAEQVWSAARAADA